MNKSEQVDFLLNLLKSTENISNIRLDNELNITSTKSEYSHIEENFYTYLNIKSIIKNLIKDKIFNPSIICTDLGLKALVCFEKTSDGFSEIFLLCPFFSHDKTAEELAEKMKRNRVAAKYIDEYLKIANNIPIVPNNILRNYAIMLNYILNDEKVSHMDINYMSNSKQILSRENVVFENHQGVWANEINFLNMFKEGNPDYIEALERCMTLSNGVRTKEGDSLRINKNNVHVLLTLISRAALEGGVLPAIAYSLHDYYAMKIEVCNSEYETTQVASLIREDFFNEVQNSKSNINISFKIQEVCNYIAVNLDQKISLQELSEKVGYTEYYLSNKFKKEMGVNINEYIRFKKVENAKILLTTTKISINEISEKLAFKNRSYFYSSFQKEVGMSPTQYRKLKSSDN